MGTSLTELSPVALNRALLARQLLLERRRLSLVRAVEQVAGLQTQYAPSAYIGLWSRVADFQRNALTRALEERRLVQATLLRSTIHIVSAGDFHLFSSGVRERRREWWARVSGAEAQGVDMAGAAAVIRTALSDGPRRAPELIAELAQAGYPKLAWQGASLWVDMVRVPPSGTWERRRADLYALAEQWVGPTQTSRAEGVAHLLARYLRAFGPAPLADAANWAGLPASDLHEAAETMHLRQFRDSQGDVLFDVPRAPLPAADTRVPVRLLPTWDATLLVHARRAQILPERFRSLVFSTKNPHSVSTFLVDGAVAGTWRVTKGAAEIRPFEPLPARVRRAVQEEVELAAAFVA